MPSTSRDRELARLRAERQAARTAALRQRRRQRNAVVGSVVAVALVAGAVVAGSLARGGSSEPSDSLGSGTTASSAPAAPDPALSPAARTAAGPDCAYEKTSDKASRAVPVPSVDDVETQGVYAVTMATDRGDIVFEMDSARAPCTAHSLRSLAEARYFDGTTCHRLTTSGISVLQCGDPTGTGMGGPGYAFADENLEGATYPRGTVAMANAGPGTNGSQFFIVHGDTALPPAYTPFGRITAGLDVLDEVAKAGTDDANGAGDGKPRLPVTVQTVRVRPTGST